MATKTKLPVGVVAPMGPAKEMGEVGEDLVQGCLTIAFIESIAEV